MFRLILLAVIGYAVYHVAKRWVRGREKPEPVDSRKEARIDDIMIKDPQCGAYFPRRDGVPLRPGKTDTLFCSVECRDKYVAVNPPTEE